MRPPYLRATLRSSWVPFPKSISSHLDCLEDNGSCSTALIFLYRLSSMDAGLAEQLRDFLVRCPLEGHNFWSDPFIRSY